MARKKTRRIVMTADRYAHPTMGDLAKGAAGFVAPRTVDDGVTLTNVLGDIGEMTPFAPAVPFLESRLGIKEWDDDTIAIMAMLGLLPFAGKITRKVNSLVPDPKGGFIRNPKFDWNKLTPEQQKATRQAMEEWTGRAQAHHAGPQTPPVYNEFLDDNLNDAVMNVAGDYKFTPKVAGQPNRNIKTQAMLPENTGEAAFLRHDPYVSNYDKVLKASRVNAEEERLARAGLLPRYIMEPYDDMGHFAKTFPTVEGSRADIGNSAKGVIIDELERKFPGYKQVMQGKGPGQGKFNRQNALYMADDSPNLTDSWIDQILTTTNEKDANVFYNTVISQLDDAMNDLQKDINKYKFSLQQNPDFTIAKELLDRSEREMERYKQQYIKAQENYNKRILDRLD